MDNMSKEFSNVQFNSLKYKLNMTKTGLTVLIVSNITFCNQIGKCIAKLIDKNEEIKVKVTEDVTDIINLQTCNEGCFDAIFVIADTTKSNFLQWVEANILAIDRNYRLLKLCVVNGTPNTGLVVNTDELINLVNKYDIPIINGEVMDDIYLTCLSETIIINSKRMAGYLTGTPCPIPTIHQFII